MSLFIGIVFSHPSSLYGLWGTGQWSCPRMAWSPSRCEGIPDSSTTQFCSPGPFGFSNNVCNVVGRLDYGASFSNLTAAVPMASVLSWLCSTHSSPHDRCRMSPASISISIDLWLMVSVQSLSSRPLDMLSRVASNAFIVTSNGQMLSLQASFFVGRGWASVGE